MTLSFSTFNIKTGYGCFFQEEKISWLKCLVTHFETHVFRIILYCKYLKNTSALDQIDKENANLVMIEDMRKLLLPVISSTKSFKNKLKLNICSKM